MIEYDVYYDEIKTDGYWHGIFFIPVDKREDFINYLQIARKDYPFIHRLHFSSLREREPLDSLRTKLTESYISIGCAALQSQKFEKYIPKAKIGKSPKIIVPVSAKFAVYKISSEVIKNCSDNKNLIIEQTLKSALKSSLHYLFSDKEDISINRILFDGESLQGINDKKIVLNLRKQLRNNVKRIPDDFIIQSSDHNKLNSHQNIEDS